MTIYGTNVSGPIPEELDGLPLSSRRGAIGMSSLARRWMDWVTAQTDPASFEYGKRIARKEQVYCVKVVPGEMTAVVAELRGEPVTVTATFELPQPSFWESFMAMTVDSPVIIAKLFAERLPDDLEDLVRCAGAELPPVGVLSTRCTCGGLSCRHAVAAHCVFTEKLDENPWLALELLGQSQRQLCNAVRRSWGDEPIPEEDEKRKQASDETQLHYGEDATIPRDTSLLNLPSFDVIERLGIPPFFPIEERNAKNTLEKLYHE